MGAIADGFTRSRLAVLPLGTINLFARELGMPSRLEKAWQTLQQGRERRVDVACADYQAAGRPARRYFVQTAGAGWDARAIDLVSWEQKKRLGPLAYVVAGLKALRGPLPPVTVTDGTTTERGPLVLIGNGRFYGGSWHVFPLADLQDGLLEVTVFPRLNPLAVLRGCSGIFLNRLHSIGGVKHFRAPQLELTCPSPEPFHVEGENVGHLPVRLSVLPQALRVLIA
jgi:diacylglycerol kinase family enzyme